MLRAVQSKADFYEKIKKRRLKCTYFDFPFKTQKPINSHPFYNIKRLVERFHSTLEKLKNLRVNKSSAIEMKAINFYLKAMER